MWGQRNRSDPISNAGWLVTMQILNLTLSFSISIWKMDAKTPMSWVYCENEKKVMRGKLLAGSKAS